MKRAMKMLLCMILAIGLVCTPVSMPLQAFATTGSSGPELVEEVYQIKTADDLYWFAGLVNGTLEDVAQNTGAKAVLCNDITVNENVLDDEGGLNDGEFKAWVPIGSEATPYTGTFDGAGHTISGLYYSSKEDADSYIGLFGYCNSSSVISNTTLEDSYFASSGTAGGICGYLAGSITNCSNDSTVIGGKKAGGIGGYTYVSKGVEGCINYGTVNSSTDAGGITGCSRSCKINNSSNYGSVSGVAAGGIIGYSLYAKIDNCYNNAVITGLRDVDSTVICGTGGMVGYGDGGSVTNSMNEGPVSGHVNVGGAVGSGDTVTITCLTNEGNVYGEEAVGGIIGLAKEDHSNDGDYVELTYLINKGDVTGTKATTGGIVGTIPYNYTYHSYYYVKIKQTYNTGEVSSKYHTLGDGSYNKSSYSKNFYDSDLLGDTTSDKYKGTPKTTAQFKSGEVAYLLGSQGGYFRQNLTGNADDYPTLDQAHKVVYQVSTYDCDGQEVGDPVYKNNSTDVQLPHKYGEPEWTWSETYEAEGTFATFTCENFDTHVKSVDAAIETEVKSATCIKKEKTIYTATVTVDGKTYTDTKTVEGDFAQHQWEDFYTVDEPASCVKAGSKSKHCSVCDASDEDSSMPVKKLEHKFDQEVVNEDTLHKAATCSKNAMYYYSCVCGEIGGETFEKLNSKASHSFDNACDAMCNVCEANRTITHDWEAATCTTPKTCKVCGEKSAEALGHDWKPATCTAPKTCAVCAETTGNALGHDWKAATCTKAKTCAVCDIATGAALGHDWKAATCTTPRTCRDCGTQMNDAKGHSIVVDAAVDATCTTEGLTEGKHCTSCDYKVPQRTISAKGHTPGAAATCTTPQTCTTCQAELVAAQGHTPDAPVVTKATAEKDGQIVTRCIHGALLHTEVIKAASKITLSKTAYTYTGKKIKAPSVIVKDADGNTIPASNYTITKPKNLKNIGKYTYTIKFTGDKYTGSQKVSMEIKAKKPAIKAPKAAKKAITVKWTKGKKAQVTGYEVAVSTNKKFKNGVNVKTVKGYTKTSYKMTKLKAKTKYFVKVRSYKTVKGVKIYSDWSKMKTIKTK